MNVSTPNWLRDLGVSAWLMTGVVVLIVGLVWLLALANVIVMPVISAAIVAAVASPVVGWLNRRGVPRAIGAALVLVAAIIVGVALTILVIGGITAEMGTLVGYLERAQEVVSGWLADLGVDPGQANQSVGDAGSQVGAAIRSLMDGVVSGILALSSAVFFAALAALSLFFLLKDGPTIRVWVERQLPADLSVARTITTRVLESLRGYFLGVALIAAYNAVVVGLGAYLLGVPMVGTIALVTFVGGFVPYLGAWGAGIFAFLIALGAGGVPEAMAMAVILLLANGILQQLVQPFAYGAALGIHPLAVLIVTIGGGAIFGAFGLILAAPAVAAASRIVSDLRADPNADDDADSAGAAPPTDADPPSSAEPLPT